MAEPLFPKPVDHVPVGPWLMMAVTLVLAGCVFLEWMDPFYFTQDDNQSQFLPQIIYAARALFDHGVFSSWNGFQLLGMPTASLGNFALTYPFTYIAYAIARFLLGNEYATIEIFAALHLAGGACLFWLCLRRLRIDPLISLGAAIGYVFIGFYLVAGRSWFNMLPAAMWLPAFAYSCAVFSDNRKPLCWIIATAVAMGLFFHSHIQMWFYGMIFWAWTVGLIILLQPQDRVRNIIFAISAILLGLALAMPLLWAQYYEVSHIPREVYGFDWQPEYFSHMLFSVGGAYDTRMQVSPFYFGWANSFYFIHPVFFLLFIAAALAVAEKMIKFKLSRRDQLVLGLLTLALLLLDYARMERGLTFSFLALIPPFSKFSHPVKVLSVFSLLLFGIGAAALQSYWQIIPARKSPWVRVLIVLSLLVTLCHLCLARYAFFYWADKPYPDLPPSLNAFQYSAKLRDDYRRVHPHFRERNFDHHYTFSMMQNYPSLYGINSDHGYFANALENNRPEYRRLHRRMEKDPQGYFEAFGITHVLLPVRNETGAEMAARWRTENPDINFSPIMQKGIVEFLAGVESFYHQMNGIGYSDLHDLFFRLGKPVSSVGEHYALRSVATSATRPLVSSDHKISIPFTIHPNGLDIALPGSEKRTEFTAAFLYAPWLKAYTADGKIIPLDADDWGRIHFDYQGAATLLAIRYEPPWGRGAQLGILLLLIALTMAWAAYPVRKSD